MGWTVFVQWRDNIVLAVADGRSCFGEWRDDSILLQMAKTVLVSDEATTYFCRWQKLFCWLTQWHCVIALRWQKLFWWVTKQHPVVADGSSWVHDMAAWQVRQIHAPKAGVIHWTLECRLVSARLSVLTIGYQNCKPVAEIWEGGEIDHTIPMNSILPTLSPSLAHFPTELQNTICQYYWSLHLLHAFTFVSLSKNLPALSDHLPWYNCDGWLGIKHQVIYLFSDHV